MSNEPWVFCLHWSNCCFKWSDIVSDLPYNELLSATFHSQQPGARWKCSCISSGVWLMQDCRAAMTRWGCVMNICFIKQLSLAQMMDCHLLSAKPLLKLDLVNILSEIWITIQQFPLEINLKILSTKWWAFFLSLSVSTHARTVRPIQSNAAPTANSCTIEASLN